MPGRVFVDTNVLAYAEDAAAGAKQVRARELIAELGKAGELVVSTQVLQELYSVATRKIRIPPATARALIEDYSRFDVVVVRPDLILAAIDLHRLHQLAFWDALIVRCAKAARCSRLLTEDLQHGSTIDGVRIENPFLASRSAEPRGRYRVRRAAARSS